MAPWSILQCHVMVTGTASPFGPAPAGHTGRHWTRVQGGGGALWPVSHRTWAGVSPRSQCSWQVKGVPSRKGGGSCLRAVGCPASCLGGGGHTRLSTRKPVQVPLAAAAGSWGCSPQAAGSHPARGGGQWEGACASPAHGLGEVRPAGPQHDLTHLPTGGQERARERGWQEGAGTGGQRVEGQQAPFLSGGPLGGSPATGEGDGHSRLPAGPGQAGGQAGRSPRCNQGTCPGLAGLVPGAPDASGVAPGKEAREGGRKEPAGAALAPRAPLCPARAGRDACPCSLLCLPAQAGRRGRGPRRAWGPPGRRGPHLMTAALGAASRPRTSSSRSLGGCMTAAAGKEQNRGPGKPRAYSRDDGAVGPGHVTRCLPRAGHVSRAEGPAVGGASPATTPPHSTRAACALPTTPLFRTTTPHICTAVPGRCQTTPLPALATPTPRRGHAPCLCPLWP